MQLEILVILAFLAASSRSDCVWRKSEDKILETSTQRNTNRYQNRQLKTLDSSPVENGLEDKSGKKKVVDCSLRILDFRRNSSDVLPDVKR